MPVTPTRQSLSVSAAESKRIEHAAREIHALVFSHLQMLGFHAVGAKAPAWEVMTPHYREKIISYAAAAFRVYERTSEPA